MISIVTSIFNRKMKAFLYPSLFFSFFLILPSCKTYDPYKPKTVEKKSLVKQIKLHVNSLNERNQNGLEAVYEQDYEGLFPVTKFKNKEDLINILLKNQEENEIRIESRIFEIHARQTMGYALLQWTAIAHPDSDQEEILYERKHLQIWEKDSKKNWRLKRSVFY